MDARGPQVGALPKRRGVGELRAYAAPALDPVWEQDVYSRRDGQVRNGFPLHSTCAPA